MWIIDIRTKQPVFQDTPNDTDGSAKPPQPEREVKFEQGKYDACRHMKHALDRKQRTIKCGECGIWLDPFWCLEQWIHYYKTNVDHRMAAIEEFEKRSKEKLERKRVRRQQPRLTLEARRQETLERAAFNEYQAKLLEARAGRQRKQVERIDAQLDQLEQILKD